MHVTQLSNLVTMMFRSCSLVFTMLLPNYMYIQVVTNVLHKFNLMLDQLDHAMSPSAMFYF